MRHDILGHRKQAGTTDEAPTAPRRLPYSPPRIVRRETVEASTLISGTQCVFDPPDPDGNCP